MNSLQRKYNTMIARLSVLVAVLSVLLFSCGFLEEPGPDHEPEPEPIDRHVIAIVASESVAAVHVVLEYEASGLDLDTLQVAGSAAYHQAHEDPIGRTSVGMVTPQPVAGDVLEIAFDVFEEDAVDTLRIVLLEGWDAAEDPVELEATSSSQSIADAEVAQSDAASVTVAATLPDDRTLDASFADHRLGDLDQNHEVDVRDVLRILRIASSALAPTDFEAYHSDFDLDGDADDADIGAALQKVVDPSLPARLHVTPQRVTFLQAEADAPLLVNNAGSESFVGLDWTAWGDPGLTQEAGVAGHSAGFTFDLGSGWSDAWVEVSTMDERQAVPLGNVAILIAGQSNASGYGKPLDPTADALPEVRMFGNDYEWKQAYEPLDDESGQVDSISREDPYDPAHSFGVRLGRLLHLNSDDRFGGDGRLVYLIPSARQGSVVHGSGSASWAPYSGRTDRSTLFGSANFRARVSAGTIESGYEAVGGPITAIVWYQGETSAKDKSARDTFIADTNAVMDAFAEELGNPHVIYVQLASHHAIADNINYQSIRERQRLMEAGVPALNTGIGIHAPRERYHMVVAHDLPRSDPVHVSTEGQRMLAERISLAIREHVLGEPVDGTGPRLEGITLSGRTIIVDTTRTINSSSTYDGYFSVRHADDPTQEVPIASLGRSPTDPTAVQIVLAEDPPADIIVRYMPPANVDSSVVLANAVRDPGTGLPLPAFGSTLDVN